MHAFLSCQVVDFLANPTNMHPYITDPCAAHMGENIPSESWHNQHIPPFPITILHIPAALPHNCQQHAVCWDSDYAAADWVCVLPFPGGMLGTGGDSFTPGDSAANCWLRVSDKLIFFCVSSARRILSSASAWLRSCKQGWGRSVDLEGLPPHVDLLLDHLRPHCSQLCLRLGAQLEGQGLVGGGALDHGKCEAYWGIGLQHVYSALLTCLSFVNVSFCE